MTFALFGESVGCALCWPWRSPRSFRIVVLAYENLLPLANGPEAGVPGGSHNNDVIPAKQRAWNGLILCT